MKRKNSMWQKAKAKAVTWIENTKAVFGSPSKAPGHEMLIQTNFARFKLSAGDFEEWVTEAFKGNEVVNGALNIIINTVCEAPIHLVDKEGIILDNHPTEQLLQHINPNETQKQFIKRFLLNLYLGDVGFIEKVFTVGGQLTELGLLRPDKVTISANKTLQSLTFIYEPNSESDAVEYQPDEIIMIPFIDPTDRLKGYSPLKSLARRIETDNEQTNHVMAVLQNGGIPGSILKVSDFLDADNALALARGFDQKVKGDKKGSTIVLHGGVEYEMIGQNFKDLEAKELAKISEAKILSTLGVPLSVYGSISGQESSTFDNMRTGVKILWRQTIIPLQSMIEDFLNNDPDLLPMKDRKKGIRIRFDRSEVEALKEDQDLLANRARLDYQAGIIYLNEARKRGGYKPIPDGDKLRQLGFDSLVQPTNEVTQNKQHKCCSTCSKKSDEILNELAKLDQEIESKSNDRIGSDFDKFAQEEGLLDRDKIKELEQKIKDYEIATKRMQLADKFSFSVFKMARKNLTKHISDFQAVIGEKDLDKEALVTKSFQKTELENRLNQLVGTWALDLQDDSLKVIGKLVEQSAQEASASVGGVFDILDNNVIEAIKAEQFKFAKQVSDTSASQIKDVMFQAFNDGLSLKDLRKEIQQLGDEFNQVRAQTIARTETVRAANKGARMGYKAAGVIKLRYTAVLDEATSEICEHLDGTIVGINEPFISEGTGFSLSNGSSMDLSYTNGGVEEPPAHVNCRSTIVPVFEDLE
jgi:HK97 family phage portal protein